MNHPVQSIVTPSSFSMVSTMNEAFGNPKGDPASIDWDRVRKQALNILDEFVELMVGLGAEPEVVKASACVFANSIQFSHSPNLKGVRDASRDINVFSDGIPHFMGIDGDRDMVSVIEGVMSRFVKDDHDKEATIKLHAAKGVTDVYFEGSYPTMIMKSASDQPDAPKGKFLKSASYREPVFYDPVA